MECRDVFSCPLVVPFNPPFPATATNTAITVTLKKVMVGTELNVVQEGIPDAIPVEACYLGWQQSLENLAKLVEPDIRQ